MAVSPVDAVAAYRAALQNMKGGAGIPVDAPQQPDSSFTALLRGVAQSTIAANRNAEKISADAIVGRAELTDVVTAVSQAETTLQTIVTVRDRVISAYQEILRMPI